MRCPYFMRKLYTIIGEAGTGRQGLAKAKQFSPDIGIVDLGLPDTDGIQLTADLMSEVKNTRIMIVGVQSKINLVVKAMQAGAMGYVLKESGSDCILNCLKMIISGKQYIDPSLSENVLELLIHANPLKNDRYQNQLTTREQEILQLIAENFSSKEIGDKLNISHRTVDRHRYNFMKKLGLKNRLEIVQFAANAGFVDLDIWKNGFEPSLL